MNIIGNGILKKSGTLVDGGLDFTISTQISEETIKFPLLTQKPVYFLIRKEPFREGEVEAIAEGMDNSGIQTDRPAKLRSSVRLRNVMFRRYEQGAMNKTFDEWYEEQMELKINEEKSQLI